MFKVHCKKTYVIATGLYCIVFIDVALFTQIYRRLVLMKMVLSEKKILIS